MFADINFHLFRPLIWSDQVTPTLFFARKGKSSGEHASSNKKKTRIINRRIPCWLAVSLVHLVESFDVRHQSWASVTLFFVRRTHIHIVWAMWCFVDSNCESLTWWVICLDFVLFSDCFFFFFVLSNLVQNFSS